jgi:hypothetical protein
MGVARQYELTVMGKRETGALERRYYSLILIQPREEADFERPWWTLRGPEGAPMELAVNAREFAEVTVGDIFTVSIENGES